MLINSSYFIGEKNIANTHYVDVTSLLNTIISTREPEYLTKALGYELFKLFEAGIAIVSPAQRYLDILLGKDFTGYDGRKTRWNGLVSLTSSVPGITVNLSSEADFFFTVGVTTGAPVVDTDTYTNSFLSGKTYRVIQRSIGPLEDGVDITKNSGGGFTFRNGIKFSDGDTFNIQLISADLDVTGIPIVPVPESPIADYVYYWYLRNQHSQTSGIGEVQTKGEHSDGVTPAHKMTRAYNAMVDKTLVLKEFLMINADTYPEFQTHCGSRELWMLLSKINPYNF